MSACNFSATQQGSGSKPSENIVDVFIEPNGTKPLVFLGEGGKKICRRGFPDESIYGLASEETKEEKEEENNQSTSATQTQKNQQLITTEVSENWFQMGLLIVNKSNTYYLVIEQLQFFINAVWGSELLSSSSVISSGYCDSDPLYIIPPTPKTTRPNAYSGDRYLPLKKNYINNLTLFITGIPVPEGLPVQNKEDAEEGTTNNSNNDRATQTDTKSTIPRVPEQFVLTYLPSYKVQLILNGHWIDKNRQPVANFRKKINFSLSSQFLN